MLGYRNVHRTRDPHRTHTEQDDAKTPKPPELKTEYAEMDLSWII